MSATTTDLDQTTSHPIDPIITNKNSFNSWLSNNYNSLPLKSRKKYKLSRKAGSSICSNSQPKKGILKRPSNVSYFII